VIILLISRYIHLVDLSFSITTENSTEHKIRLVVSKTLNELPLSHMHRKHHIFCVHCRLSYTDSHCFSI